MRYSVKIFAGVICVTLLSYLPYAFLCAAVDDEAYPFQSPYATRKFNRSEWMACNFERGQGRGHMFYDLVDYHLHIGMTKSEVTNLLGEGEEHRNADVFSPDMTVEGVCVPSLKPISQWNTISAKISATCTTSTGQCFICTSISKSAM